jgi:sulfate transport system substrate-binding protein
MIPFFFSRKSLASVMLAIAVATNSAVPSLAGTTLLNVSYDPTRELYKDFNEAFIAHWKAETGEDVTIQQSHGDRKSVV